MICNDDTPVAIAGIMGGLDSEIVDDTTKLTLESATFDCVSIRKSTVRLSLTEPMLLCVMRKALILK